MVDLEQDKIFKTTAGQFAFRTGGRVISVINHPGSYTDNNDYAALIAMDYRHWSTTTNKYTSNTVEIGVILSDKTTVKGHCTPDDLRDTINMVMSASGLTDRSLGIMLREELGFDYNAYGYEDEDCQDD